ncbi:MAG: N-acetylmuramoyl-L-alanine amidase [Verrucomicrobia bacterium]|nr:N-acetylmuramoyl-L-alanine amidase [Verrucomicrobiota bacterium]HNW08204.1 N-acetylmuramoyl-L-alanine amidase [Verrucomicrobiota bacterium]HOX61898.1 N-acetylmuramoyl-L-alanine amidase [Verrucomicrobiota bacterium]HPI65856.1 N-acetylmuramoyl-L-alanine amidase [Verrucomicrobiota bacterium]HPO42078.1 N-acetylmuramoyl-L-alanine amidase [Verrucomicrobiota bacterium]
MNTKQFLTLSSVSLVGASAALATADYGPAVDRMITGCSKWYTSGYGHKFAVVHSMEGYYLTGTSYLRRCDISASCHYTVNGKTDYAGDAAPGEISQLVREAYYAWHATCWNQHSLGTEHEGFVGNPAWFTDAMYQASALLHRHFADKFGFAKDRNHIVGHGEKSNAAWCSYASANLGINPYCNTHTDPGPYWNWTYFMSLINPPAPVVVDNSNAGFTASSAWATGTAAGDKYGANYRWRSTQAVSDPASWSASNLPAGTYKIYAWWSAGSNRSTAAPYIVYHSGGSTTVTMNQQANGGKWNLLGTFNLNAGTGKVSLSCWAPSGYVVVADAIKWVR